MKFLLINTNQIVQKLVEITAKKAGADLTTIKELSGIRDLELYHYVIVDDDCLDSENKQAVLNALENKRKCLIHNKQGERIEGFNDYIQKPFLPTSILDIFTAQLQRESNEYAEQTPPSLEQSSQALEISDPIDLDNLDEGLEEVHTLLDEDLNLTELESDQPEKSAESELLNKTTEGDSLQEIALEQPTENPESAQDATNNTQDSELGQDLGESGLEDLDLNLDELDIGSEDFLTDLPDEVGASSDTDEEGLGGDSILEADLDEQLDLSDLDEIGASDENAEQEIPGTSQDEQMSDSEIGEEEPLSTDEVGSALPSELNEDGDEMETNEPMDPEDSIAQEPNMQSELDDLLAQPDQDKSAESALEDPTAQDLPTEDLEDLGDLGDLGDLENLDANPDPTEDLEALGGLDELGELDLGSENAGLPSESSEDLQSGEDQLDLLAEGDASTFDLDSELNDLPPSILDTDQIHEVSQALDALESTPSQEPAASAAVDNGADSEENDFSTLKEPEIAQALGEEFAKLDEQMSIESFVAEESSDTQEVALAQPSTAETDIVKSIIASSVQNSISSLSTGNLKSMLDGLEVTINISFKDKSK